MQVAENYIEVGSSRKTWFSIRVDYGVKISHGIERIQPLPVDKNTARLNNYMMCN